jgi:hypothetical protein
MSAVKREKGKGKREGLKGQGSKGARVRARSLIVILLIAIVVAGVAVGARQHGGLHRWIMSIHGR